MSDEDMDAILRLVALESELQVNDDVAGIPTSFHAADVVARYIKYFQIICLKVTNLNGGI